MRLKLTLIISLLTISNWSYALTVDEAYQSIPHKRTEYSAEKSTLPLNTKIELEKLFKISDRALVGRIETMKGLSQGHAEVYNGYQTKIDAILNELSETLEPEGVQLATLLKSAISSQRDYFKNWHDALAAGKTFHSPGSDSDVQKASSALRQLYSVLMTRYRTESPNNVDAFYQHLCALDFL